MGDRRWSRQTDRWASAKELRLSPLFAYPGPLWGPLMHDLLRSAKCLYHVRFLIDWYLLVIYVGVTKWETSLTNRFYRWARMNRYKLCPTRHSSPSLII